MLDKEGELTNMSFPSLSSTSSSLVESMALTQTARLLASRSETTRFTMFMNRVYNPIDAGITTNGFVLRVDQDDLEILVCGVLIDPIRIENSQIRTSASNTLLSRRL